VNQLSAKYMYTSLMWPVAKCTPKSSGGAIGMTSFCRAENVAATWRTLRTQYSSCVNNDPHSRTLDWVVNRIATVIRVVNMNGWSFGHFPSLRRMLAEFVHNWVRCTANCHLVPCSLNVKNPQDSFRIATNIESVFPWATCKPSTKIVSS